MSVSTVRPPSSGVWRVGRSPDPFQLRPLSTEDLDQSELGSRFDSPDGSYGVLYFARTLEACFGETLARFRPDLELLALVSDEWKEMGFMEPGAVPREWRERRLAVRVRLITPLTFIDVEDAGTIELLRRELATELLDLGYKDLDLSTVRGSDRRVTRLVSQWAFSQTEDDDRFLYGGIRYLSRLDSKWECWAVFQDVDIEELVRQPIFSQDTPLRRVAKLYGLTVH